MHKTPTLTTLIAVTLLMFSSRIARAKEPATLPSASPAPILAAARLIGSRPARSSKPRLTRSIPLMP